MAYCVESDVRARCDTDCTAGEIDLMIDESDAWLDFTVGAANMALMTAPMQRLLSATRTAIMIYLKDPEDQSLGEYSESRAYALKKLNATFDEMLEGVLEEFGIVGGIGFRYSYATLPRSYTATG